jgi:ATP-dependent HslUV protease ATP-binding subunit HslU
MLNLTPKQIVAELDKYIIGQAAAKRAVAVAVRNRWRRRQLSDELRQDVAPKNIIMIGPTGVGKTEIARRLAGLTNSPFIKVEATKYTEVGYQGRDVESMIRDLLDVAIGIVRDEMTESVRGPAEAAVEDRLLDALLPSPGGFDEEARERHQRTREKLREKLKDGSLEAQTIEISVEEKPNVMNMLGSAGLDMDPSMQSMFERMMPARRDLRRMSVHDARKMLLSQEAENFFDKGKLIAAAIERTEQSGIVFLDEIDKICGVESKSGPDVSRQGVQRDLLPIVEGSTVTTKHGPVKTDHILFIAAGAFHSNSPSDLMPELQGRFPIRVELSDLTEDDFGRILREPKNSLIKQQMSLLKTEGLEIEFTDDAIESIAEASFEANRKNQNIGARRLHTVLERVLESLSYDAPDRADKRVTINAGYVKQRLKEAGRFTM